MADPWWAPLVTMLGGTLSAGAGYLAKVGNDWLQDGRARRREQLARLEARRDFLVQRAADAQRDVLLGLQDNLNDLVTAAVAIRRMHEISGKWDDLKPDDPNLEAVRSSTSKLIVLNSRVLSSEIRAQVDSVVSRSNSLARSAAKRESDGLTKVAAREHSDLDTLVGRAIRDLDEQLLAEVSAALISLDRR
jgi:hypothetical protein